MGQHKRSGRFITWEKRFPLKEIVSVYKKEHNGRNPTKEEIKTIKESGYFNADEW